MFKHVKESEMLKMLYFIVYKINPYLDFIDFWRQMLNIVLLIVTFDMKDQ